MFCGDYDALTTYEPGSFCSQHRTDLTGRIERVNLNAITDMDDLNSFLNQSYESYITTAPLILYRAFGAVKKDSGKIAGAWATGRFISTEFAESMIDVKNRLALAPEWFNTKMYEEKLLVPAGTEFYLGIVAPVKMKSGTILSGGAQQILLTERCKKEWVLGCRRITSRQITHVPKYKLADIPDEVEKKDLYPVICPVCGSANIVTLSENEQFSIRGCKGNTYTMKHHCLDADCEYYW